MMEENLESLEAKYRLEKKELQAQIQALKKTAKNDKSKRKDILAEITRLENDLETRHKEKLMLIQSNKFTDLSDNEHEESNISADPSKVRISKAQKRRDRKAQIEKERAEQIKLQEEENRHGPRNQEIQSIKVKLKERGLKLFEIPSDGDCLYKAVSHQLHSTRNVNVDVETLRKNVSEYIKNNKEDFIPFMSNPETFEMLSDIEFDEYCNNIVNSKVWGGQLEIRALSNHLKCPIQVIQATGPDSIDQGTEFEGTPLVITFHRHMYRLGEHYNSTQDNTVQVESN